MGKKVFIIQSNYIPWKGYFDAFASVDEVVLLDEVQYTKRDWRNRNKIKTPEGLFWLSIPVQSGAGDRNICDVQVSDPGWAEKHWKTWSINYGRAPHFKAYASMFQDLYLGSTEQNLSKINFRFISAICGLLNIDTPIRWSHEFHARQERTERLVDICSSLGATEYVSGPAAKSYIDESKFEERGMKVTYFDYSGYPAYPQIYPPFEHAVSVLDLIFNVGPDARKYMVRSPERAPLELVAEL